MVDHVKCDTCGTYGCRPRFRPAPDGWLYIASKDDSDEDEEFYVYACSDACAAKSWQRGPGERFDVESTGRTDHLDEALNAASKLLDSLGEYMRQTMHENPEWRSGVVEVERVLAKHGRPGRFNVAAIHVPDIQLDAGNDTSWPVREVLGRLVHAAEHLLDAHCCDTHGHEGIRDAVKFGRQYLSEEAANG